MKFSMLDCRCRVPLLLRLVLHTAAAAAVGCVTLSSLSELTHIHSQGCSVLCSRRCAAAPHSCSHGLSARFRSGHRSVPWPVPPGCPMDERILSMGEEGRTEQLMQLRAGTSKTNKLYDYVYECVDSCSAVAAFQSSRPTDFTLE